jgi:hypothetical protein
MPKAISGLSIYVSKSRGSGRKANLATFHAPQGLHTGRVLNLSGFTFFSVIRENLVVTEQYIEIIHGPDTLRPSTLRFHNPDVPQPWLKKVGKES